MIKRLVRDKQIYILWRVRKRKHFIYLKWGWCGLLFRLRLFFILFQGCECGPGHCSRIFLGHWANQTILFEYDISELSCIHGGTALLLDFHQWNGKRFVAKEHYNDAFTTHIVAQSKIVQIKVSIPYNDLSTVMGLTKKITVFPA